MESDLRRQLKRINTDVYNPCILGMHLLKFIKYLHLQRNLELK